MSPPDNAAHISANISPGASPAAGTRFAVFDVDGTLVADNIGTVFVAYLLRRRACSIMAKLLIFCIYPLYKIGLLDFRQALLLGARALHGIETGHAESLAADCFETYVKHRIFGDALAEIGRVRAEGRIVILATGAHETIARALAAHVGADRLVATRSLAENGRYTLEVRRPLPYKDGKRDLVAAVIDEYPGPADVTIYTDEQKDLALLGLATQPVAVNADPATTAYALANGGRRVVWK